MRGNAGAGPGSSDVDVPTFPYSLNLTFSLEGEGIKGKTPFAQDISPHQTHSQWPRFRVKRPKPVTTHDG